MKLWGFKVPFPLDNDNGWGSDFDDVDEEDDEEEKDCAVKHYSDAYYDRIAPFDANVTHSLVNLKSHDTNSHSMSNRMQTLSLQSLSEKKRTKSPPPLPKHPPPDMFDIDIGLDCIQPNSSDIYQPMSGKSRVSDDNEYLLPNSSRNNGNYEYIQYNKFKRTNSHNSVWSSNYSNELCSIDRLFNCFAFVCRPKWQQQKLCETVLWK